MDTLKNGWKVKASSTAKDNIELLLLRESYEFQGETFEPPPTEVGASSVRLGFTPPVTSAGFGGFTAPPIS